MPPNVTKLIKGSGRDELRCPGMTVASVTTAAEVEAVAAMETAPEVAKESRLAHVSADRPIALPRIIALKGIPACFKTQAI